MKTTSSITLDVELVIKAREKNINLSNLVNNCLKIYFETKDELKGRSKADIEEEIEKRSVEISKLQSKVKDFEKVEVEEQKKYSKVIEF